MRSLNADGEDPARVVHRDDGPLPSRETFQSCAEELIASKQAGWRNKKHVQQWHNTLRDYVYPMIGRRHPSEITLSHVKAILEPIWATKTETATRVRQRIEAVLDWAYVHELRSGENPARWRGVLDKVLPPPRKVTAVKHLAACPYEEVPAVMHALRGSGHIGAHCLRFLILTATRSGEAREARWDEIDLDQAIWTIPAERIKRGSRTPCAAINRSYRDHQSAAEVCQSTTTLPQRTWRKVMGCDAHERTANDSRGSDRPRLSIFVPSMGGRTNKLS